MIIPVRCMSCGEIIGDKWEKFKKAVDEGKDPKKTLDDLGIKKYCCRCALITNVDLTDEIAAYKKRLIPRKEREPEAPVV